MMDMEVAFRRAQMYGFLSTAFLYPRENWMKDLPFLPGILRSLGMEKASLTTMEPLDLGSLQDAYRMTFGVAGSLSYETEYGLPHEYRMSQELADIAGFYRAFGFAIGGVVHERPDHIAVELEFMHAMALKEACAQQSGQTEHLAVCRDGQKKFLVDHLGKWIHLLAKSLANQGVSPFPRIAQLAADFVDLDARTLGVSLNALNASEVQPTPFDPDFSCAGCACAEASTSSPGGVP